MARIAKHKPDRFEAYLTPTCYLKLKHHHTGPGHRDGLSIFASHVWGLSLNPKQVCKLYEWLGEWLKRNSA